MNRFSPRQRWTRRQALWLLAGAAGSVGLHGCTQAAKTSTGGTQAADLVPATVAVTNWIGNTPIYIASGKQFFQKEGLDLTIRTFVSTAESFPLFSAGQIEGVVPVTAEAVSLAAQGTDYKIVLVTDLSSGGDAILARNSISDIQDLKGKRIALQKGGVGHFFVLQVLAEAGMSEKDVTIVDTTVEAAVSAYKAGNVEIVYSHSPYLEDGLASQKDGRIIYDSSKMPTAIADVYAFNTDFIKSNPAAVQAFVNGVMKGLDFLKSSPDEALEIAAKPYNVQPEELKTQLKGIQLPDLQTNIEMLSNPQSDLYLLNSLNQLAQFLKDQNQIETVPNMADWIDPQFVQALSRNS